MKNLQFLRKYLFVILSFIGVTTLFSQQFSVNLNILPPYSPFYRDYIGYVTNNTKTIVTLTYINPTSNSPVKVFLTASLRKDNNSISVQLKDNYRPGTPIVLLPNIPQTLTGTQLRNIFGNGTTSDLEMTGITTQEIVTNQAMPEGTYNICIKLKAYDTNTLLAETCRSMFIAYSEPPQIITPMNNMSEIAKNPQYVNVSWSPVSPFTRGMTYRLRMVKLLPGISPYDAINYSTQVVLEKSNIRGTSYALDLASGIKLDTGSVYVLQVTGITPEAYIKNGGKSESIQFMYKSLPKFKPDIIIPQGKNSDFTFLNPKPNLNNVPDTLKVRNDSSLLINWCWIKQINKDTSVVNDQEVIKNMGLQKYVLDIKKSSKNKSIGSNQPQEPFSFSRSFEKIDSTGMIKNFINLTDSETVAAGFEDGKLYNASLSYYDANNKLIDTKISSDFLFRKLKDAIPMVQIPVQAVIKYGFKNFPEIYPVMNTEIIVEAYKAQNSKSAGNKKLGTNLNLFSELPTENIGDSKQNLVKIASKVVTTDTLGRITTKIPIPEIYFDTDSIFYRLKISNKYYVDKDFGTITMPVTKKDTIINFGQLIAKTYAYQLKLNVSKRFTAYNLTRDNNGLTVKYSEGAIFGQSSNNTVDGKTQSYVFDVMMDTIAEGIPVVLYRENKQNHIPPCEGNIVKTPGGSTSNTNNITVVALGVTQLEKDSTYVTFNKLLATNQAGEEYKLIAIKNLDELLFPKSSKTKTTGQNISTEFMANMNYSGISAELNNNIANAIFNATQSGTTTNFVDSAKFIAEPMSFKLPLPVQTNSEDAYYRTVKANYNIISCKPPTSILKGRLFYTWKSDVNHVKRPLANAHFRVMVDYVDGKNQNTSIGAVNNTNSMLTKIAYGHWEYTSFQPDNSNEVIPLVDQYATMAEGTTDNEGNFIIEVVNINKKGSLGSGKVSTSEGSSKPPITGKNPKQELEELLKGGPVINPVDQSGLLGQENLGLQGTLNGGNLNIGFDAGTNSFEVSGVKNKGGMQTEGFMNLEYAPIDEYGHGPQPSTPMSSPTPSESTSKSYSDFKRMFRIVIDGDEAPHYYPSADVIEIQPFENQNTPLNITHFVREFAVNAKTYDGESDAPLSEMQVTLFRGPEKPEKLPLGEGDGKYTYKELNSPVYDSINTQIDTDVKEFQSGFNYSQKFEQLWPSRGVKAIGSTFGDTLPSLLQSEYNNYYVQASSYVNTGSKAYTATIREIPVFEDKTTNWSNPEIPVMELKIELTPLLSRALVRVKDSVSKKNLTTDQLTRVIIANKPLGFIGNIILGDHKSTPVDKYGYAELLVNKYPLNEYVKSSNDYAHTVEVFFYAKANGYNYFKDQVKVPYSYKGKQATPVLSLYPSARIKGRIINADMPTNTSGNNTVQINSNLLNGVRCYLQADSGKIFETDDFGNFEDIPIAPNAGTRFKIIPKDVAWFDTAYVLSVADSKKQDIDLGKISVFRRKHRLQFNITKKMQDGFVGPATPISGATIQLGETVKTTAQNGTAKFEFENVSVNNYTFVIKGPQGQGYIPKTIPVKSFESKNFENKNIVLEKGSEVTGTVTLDGKPVKNARVYIDVANTSSQNPMVNYDPIQQTASSQTAVPQLGTGNGQPVNNYQVNTNLGNNTNEATGKIDADANLVVAYTDANGKYKLQGVPVNNQKINILATLDTTFTVSGDEQQADIKNGIATTDLKLTSFGQGLINKLYGFPLTVEKITPVSNTQVKVTGLVHWTEAISDFNLEEVNKVLRVEDVLYDLVNINNVVTGVAHENSVEIPGITNIKLSYINKYNVNLSSPKTQGLFNTSPLTITKEEDYGKISGKMKIVDNSFNYPSSYLSFDGSEFYLAKLNNRLVNNIVSVATSAYTETESIEKSFSITENYRKSVDAKVVTYRQQVKPVYYLCDKNADSIQFKLINFTAKADPGKSYIDTEGKIHLNTMLTCHIDNAQPEDFRVNIPDMILDENKVYPAKSAEPLKLKLEEWTLEARNWEFSTTEGGILSTDATIRTKIIDIPVGKFVLRSDMFMMDKYKMDQLTMAGGKIKLTGVDPTKAGLVYEYKVGSDMKPHWNFCLLGGGSSKVASLPELGGLNGYNIDLNYIEILSNNEMIVQLMQKTEKARLQGNPLAKFEPLSIFNGPNYINVNGLLNIGAPRMSDIDLTVNWTGTDKINAFENVSTDFEGKGFVHFEATKQKITISDKLITIEGRVLEKPDRTFNPIPATLYAQINSQNFGNTIGIGVGVPPVVGLGGGSPSYQVVLQKDWITQLSEDEPDGSTSPKSSDKGYNLKIINGGMKVENGDWNTLKYTGWMRNNDPDPKAKADNITETKTTFEILGAVSANSEGMSLSGIDTPFGSMSQSFDFKKKELIGSLKINTEITLGTARLHSGTIETCFGAEGFYLAGGCYAFLPAGILTGDYNIGFMAGHHKLTNQLWEATNSYIDPSVRNECYKQKTPNLSGCFMAFNREIINKSLSFDYVIASGYVKALALIGGDFYVNASDGFKIGGEGYVNVNVSAGLSAITGTSISGGVNGKGQIVFQVGDPSYFDAKIKLGFNASLEQSLGITTISKSVSVDCKAEAGTSGFNFDIGSDGNSLSCP